MEISAARAHKAFHRNKKQESGLIYSENPNAYRETLENSFPPKEKDVNRLLQEIFTLLVGGTATTARVLTRLTFFLTTNPSSPRRLKEGLEQIMPDPIMMPELEELEELLDLVSLDLHPSSLGRVY